MQVVNLYEFEVPVLAGRLVGMGAAGPERSGQHGTGGTEEKIASG